MVDATMECDERTMEEPAHTVCVCVLAIEMSHEDFKQGKDMIQFMFLKGKSSPIQTFKSRQKKVPPLYGYSYK